MASQHAGKISILVVDDSRLIRVAAAKMFGDEFDVLLAVDGREALTVLQSEETVHVVITDLAMPEMDGFELLRAIRKHEDEQIRKLPVIVATGAGNTEAAKQKAFSLGATDFVSKPFHTIDLKARVRSYATLRKENNSLIEQVTVDELTGLLNHRGIQHQLDKELSFVARHRSTITVLSIEIDNYKDLFVRIGRNGTEKLVRRISGVLASAFRKEDSVARSSLAGFTVSLPMSEPPEVMQVARRIIKTVSGFKAKLDGRPINISVSVGVSSLDQSDKSSVGEVLAMTEKALSLAKRDGTSQMKYLSTMAYRQVLEDEARKNLSIDELLTEIEEGNELAVTAQLDSVLIRLGPLFELLSNEQYQRLFEMRQHKAPNNVYSLSRTSA